MSDIVRAWKDETYRQNLSVEEQGVLPANPVGEIDLTDEELEAVYGAQRGSLALPVYFGVTGPADNRQWMLSGGASSFVEGGSCNDPFTEIVGSGTTGTGLFSGLGGALGITF